MDYKKWIEEAKNIINTKLEKGKSFELKSLFPEYEWGTLSAGEKRAFGRYFSNEVAEGRVNGVRKISEGKNHHNRYIKGVEK